MKRQLVVEKQPVGFEKMIEIINAFPYLEISFTQDIEFQEFYFETSEVEFSTTEIELLSKSGYRILITSEFLYL
jgi:hypothetical protein